MPRTDGRGRRVKAGSANASDRRREARVTVLARALPTDRPEPAVGRAEKATRVMAHLRRTRVTSEGARKSTIEGRSGISLQAGIDDEREHGRSKMALDRRSADSRHPMVRSGPAEEDVVGGGIRGAGWAGRQRLSYSDGTPKFDSSSSLYTSRNRSVGCLVLPPPTVGDPYVSPREQSGYTRFEVSSTRQRLHGLSAIELKP